MHYEIVFFFIRLFNIFFFFDVLHVIMVYGRTACVCVRRLQIHQDLRDDLAKVKTLEALANVSQQLKLRCQVTDAPAGKKKANAKKKK